MKIGKENRPLDKTYVELAPERHQWWSRANASSQLISNLSSTKVKNSSEVYGWFVEGRDILMNAKNDAVGKRAAGFVG